ncbi:hypothetical protein PN836_010275 [Ningiella sp. W23]|uniref:hypothetical protein n=1 Tax=Ningiella sp. W23 TaxID=3023715 RepID=UPI0037580E1C
MKIIPLLFFALFSNMCFSQVLVKSEHSVKKGMAESNQFPKTCTDECSFLLYLDVAKLHFDEEFASGAYILVFNTVEGKSISFGVQANVETQEAELVVLHNDENTNPEPILLAKSALNTWEGFNISWEGKNLLFENLRSVKKIGYNSTPYSSLESSGITYETELDFVPEGFGYMFMSSDVELWIDIESQNYNEEWRPVDNGN